MQEEAEQEEAQDQQEDAEQEEVPPANLSEEETQRWYHGWRTCDNDAGAGAETDGRCLVPEVPDTSRHMHIRFVANFCRCDTAPNS